MSIINTEHEQFLPSAVASVSSGSYGAGRHSNNNNSQTPSDQTPPKAQRGFKVFKALMALTAAFSLQTKQLNAFNAFLNAHNDEIIYCRMPDEYAINEKVMKIIKALYDQRKSPLLWLRILTRKCIYLKLYSIPGEPCLFTNKDGIFLFFYVDDIVLAYRYNRQKKMEAYVQRLKDAFEIRDLGEIEFFLGIRIIQNIEAGAVNLMQDSYMDKLMKDYDFNPYEKFSATPLHLEDLKPHEGPVDDARVHLYRKKVGSTCYSVIMTRPDVAKAASKLAEFLINFSENHMRAADQCLQY